ncbi:hypothetical protein F443_02476 [Phytophthora nicotianae P1569]|uniref:Uncharacterized protein n=2 Tax=Phytophthora nicotianae TaxID=4792 RepID=V9FWI3_PHYNI|nr:hypothetical protein F443_02476 [Phytophthora nicotianae P1569]
MYVFSIDWAINTPHAVVYGDLEPPEADKKCSTQLRKLLDAGVSYIVQKIAVQGKAAFIETASGPASGFDFIDSSLEQLAGTVAISMCDLAEPETMGLFVTVTKTAKTQFQLSLDLWEMTGQYVQHAGSMLSLMLSGSASSLLEVFRCAQSVPLAVICWNISSYMVEPVCSAIANIKSALNVTLDLNDLVSEPISDWGWLVEDEIREIKDHDGEFLPLTKEKLPIQMKVALLSVVAGFRDGSLTRMACRGTNRVRGRPNLQIPSGTTHPNRHSRSSLARPTEISRPASSAAMVAIANDKKATTGGVVAARLLGSTCSGLCELMIFHPVDTIAKRLMTNKEPMHGMAGLNKVIFRDAYEKPVFARYRSLFPGLGFAAG